MDKCSSYPIFRCGSAGKESTCSMGDLCSIPGLGRYSAEGKVYILQFSGLENSKDQSMGSQRVRHDSATFTTTVSNISEGKFLKWFLNDFPQSLHRVLDPSCRQRNQLNNTLLASLPFLCPLLLTCPS